MNIDPICLPLEGNTELLRALTHISLILFCFVFASCEKEFEIEYINVEKYVVVNSTFCPNKLFEVNLSFSKNVLDGDTPVQWVDDAEIRVLRGDGVYLFSPDYVGEGNYRASTYPIENQIYKIEVKVDGYPTITASSRIPTQAIVENVTTTNLSQDGDGAVQVDFDIKDSEELNNYYIWEILQEDPSLDNPNPNPSVFLAEIQTLGPSEEVQNIGKWSKLFIQEHDFNAGLSFLSFLEQSSDSQEPGAELPEIEAYLKVVSASEDYYENLLSLEKLKYNQGNNNSSDIVLSNGYHGNIKNGFGIFAGYNELVIKL